KMVAKWFNRKENGCFDMNMVAERGSYNASEMDVELAKAVNGAWHCWAMQVKS
ncbi:MAG: hypothetical protein HC831_22110, partial [Chloroflexia bacterium]|nr:hypothetical protein [Chloroflexia bacterium]